MIVTLTKYKDKMKVRLFEHKRCALIHIYCLIIATTNVYCSIYTDAAVHSRYTLLFVPSIILPEVSVILICSCPLCGMQYLILFTLGDGNRMLDEEK